MPIYRAKCIMKMDAVATTYAKTKEEAEKYFRKLAEDDKKYVSVDIKSIKEVN